MEVPKLQAKVSIPMVLQEVFEAIAVVTLDSGPISLINGVFGDVRKELWVHEDSLEVDNLAVDSID